MGSVYRNCILITAHKSKNRMLFIGGENPPKNVKKFEINLAERNF